MIDAQLRGLHALPFPAKSASFALLLRRKARGRKARTARFFGEAFVASHTPHREVFYGSFKWLTNQRFASKSELPDADQERFREALHRHFTEDYH